MCSQMNRKVDVACNFNCLFENEGLLKVTVSHVHCKCGNILETVHDGVIYLFILFIYLCVLYIGLQTINSK